MPALLRTRKERPTTDNYNLFICVTCDKAGSTKRQTKTCCGKPMDKMGWYETDQG